MSVSSAVPLAGLPRPVQWAVLLPISAIVVSALEMAHLPAALMLGPMIAGILMETGGGTIRIPRIPLNAAQAVIGCMIAQAITPGMISEFCWQWPLILGVVSIIVSASCIMGFFMCRLQILPGTAALWGVLPGAAPAMMLMAEGCGADFRLVAFMQYLRVAFVAITASVVGRLWLPENVRNAMAAHATVWFPAFHPAAFAGTLVLVAASLAVGIWSRVTAAFLIAPLVIGSVVHIGFGISIDLPPWFLAVSYALIGWNTGLRFTREVLAAAARALPQIVISIVALIAFCGGLAAVMAETLGVDPLTAYLATSPGGIDSVAIIAASTKVDIPFVLSLQTFRFLMLLVVGPPISKFVVGLLPESVLKADCHRPPTELRSLERTVKEDFRELD